jgi:hypothetical protein
VQCSARLLLTAVACPVLAQRKPSLEPARALRELGFVLTCSIGPSSLCGIGNAVSTGARGDTKSLKRYLCDSATVSAIGAIGGCGACTADRYGAKYIRVQGPVPIASSRTARPRPRPSSVSAVPCARKQHAAVRKRRSVHAVPRSDKRVEEADARLIG